MLKRTAYRTIAEHPDYKVTERGRVWSSQRAVFLKPLKIGGYLAVILNDKTRYIHRLVLEAFVGPCPSGLVARHLNGDLTDNWLTNLAWRAGGKLLSAEDEVDIIKLRKRYGWSVTEFCRIFSVSRTQIKRLIEKGEK